MFNYLFVNFASHVLHPASRQSLKITGVELGNGNLTIKLGHGITALQIVGSTFRFVT